LECMGFAAFAWQWFRRSGVAGSGTTLAASLAGKPWDLTVAVRYLVDLPFEHFTHEVGGPGRVDRPLTSPLVRGLRCPHC
jgi:hypothetical protein